MTEPSWLTAARKMIGTLEVPGRGNNPKVVELYEKAGHPEIKADEVPWCAAFVGAMLKDGGVKGSGSLAARSYEAWGQPCNGPVLGAVAVKRRAGGGWVGHVAFVVAANATTVWLLGGNQGDKVSIAPFPRTGAYGVKTFRWPANIPICKDPLPKSASGSAGSKEI